MPMGGGGYPIDSRAVGVNDAGTILFMTFSSNHRYVVTSAGAVIDLGANLAFGLSNNDTMAGYRRARRPSRCSGPRRRANPRSCRHWPVDTTRSRRSSRCDVIGTATDASGTWVVRWVNSAGAVGAACRPAATQGQWPGGMNSAGRSARLYDPVSAPYGWDHRPAVWDRRTRNRRSSADCIRDGGRRGRGPRGRYRVGVVTASSKTVRTGCPSSGRRPLPWQVAAAVRRQVRDTHGVNAYRQIAGTVNFVTGGARQNTP